MAAYSVKGALLLGRIPWPINLAADRVVQTETEETDSKLGHIFDTPFDLSDTGPLSRPARLLIKRINNSLASGRLLLAISSPEENKNVHAYGWNLVKEALDAITCIIEGDIKLDGAPPADGLSTDSTVSTPLINNLDPESHVEAFYDRIANPNWMP